VKIETTEAGLSPTFRGSGLRRWRVSEAEHRRTCARSHGDPLTDGRGVERVQWRHLRFIEAIAGVVAQQAPSHEQAQDSRSNDTEQGVDLLVGGRFGGCEGKRAVRLSHEDPVDRQRVEAHVQVQCAAKVLDDGDRTGTAASVTRCLGSLSVEALQRTRVDREHRAAEAVIPGKPIAKLEGKAQDPLSNRNPREHVVDEMCGALGHPTATAARAEAAAFARERNQPIGATVGTAKPGKPMREHTAANESLELALHEQGGATLVLTSMDLPEEGLKVVANDAVEHPMLRSAAHVRSGSRLARSCGVKLHDDGAPSRLVPWLATAFSTHSRETAVKRSGERRRNRGGRQAETCQPRCDGSHLSVGHFRHVGQRRMSFSNSLISSSMRSNGHDWSTCTLTS
jgi:hypothetical protein